MKPKVYIETSVLSYLTARPSRDTIVAGNQAATREWWERRTDFDLYISVFVLEESRIGDSRAADARLQAISGVPEIEITPDVALIAEGLLSKASPSGKSQTGCATYCRGNPGRHGLSADLELHTYCQSSISAQKHGGADPDLRA